MDNRKPPNAPIDGFPPGYEFKRKAPLRNESQVAAEKRAKAVQDFQSGGLKGIPVEFDENGPIIEEEVFNSMDEEEAPPSMPDPRIAQNLKRAELGRQRQIQQQAQRQAQVPPQTQRAQPQRPPAPVQQQAPVYQEQREEVYPGHPKYQHPVLQRMLEKFGLKNPKTYDLIVTAPDGEGSVTYTMSMVPEEVTIWALNEAQSKAQLEGDHIATTWFEIMVSSSAVVAIDKEPIYRVLSIRPNPEEMKDLEVSPLSLSNRLRKLCGKALAELFWSKTLPMGDKLTQFYSKKVIADYKVTSSLDKEAEGLVRFVCPVDGCMETLLLAPVMENGEEKPYFCKVHGEAMMPVGGAKEENSLPLE